MDAKERRAALEKLWADSERFWAQTDVRTCSVPELIDRFLKSTDSTQSEHDRLNFFKFEIGSHLGWGGVCQVHEYILVNEPDSVYSTYAMWITYGRAVIKNDESLSLEERIRVATDIEAIIERAVEEADYAPEQSLGHFYYEHPLKAEQPELYLLKSKEWFERFIETEDFNEHDHHDLQTLGHVYFELGDFKTALHWYKKFETAEDGCGDACVMDRKLAEKRLVECQQRLTESDS